MQEIIVAKPYRFIPPHRGNWIPWLVQRLRVIDFYLRRYEGVHSHEVRGIEFLKDSLAQGHGVLLAPNHCRYADPLALAWIARLANVNLFSMASWHLFHQGWFQAFAMRMCGAFSVYREGLDRHSLETAIDILAGAQRPLVVFPEGAVFRTNDQLQPLLEGVAFLARSAARRRAKLDQGQVVIHPVAIKYVLRADVRECVEPAIKDLEQRFTWQGFEYGGDLVARVSRLEEALLALKEIQFLGAAQTGDLAQRRGRLIASLLDSVDQEWLGRRQDAEIIPRIKQLRSIMLPQLLDRATSVARVREIWAALAKLYLAQQVASYPKGYLDYPSSTRLLETVERLEEDVTDRARTYRPLHVILQIDHAIRVDPERSTREGTDPLMTKLSGCLQHMLDELTHAASPLPPWSTS